MKDASTGPHVAAQVAAAWAAWEAQVREAGLASALDATDRAFAAALEEMHFALEGRRLARPTLAAAGLGVWALVLPVPMRPASAFTDPLPSG